MRKFVIVAFILVAMGAVLWASIAVNADLKATAVVYAWDEAAFKFQNSNVVINLDGGWTPFWHELNFDQDVWTESLSSSP